jgi:type IV protein arginine methyltransferase
VKTSSLEIPPDSKLYPAPLITRQLTGPANHISKPYNPRHNIIIPGMASSAESIPDLIDADEEIQIQMILLAASQHDIPKLRALLKSGSANVQDSETGYTPLHAAIIACEIDEPAANGHMSGDGEHSTGEKEDIENAAKTMRLLLQNGAIWNDLDANGETPGCVAYRLGLTELYEIMVDAGVRAEMLLNRLDDYEPLGGGEEEEEEEEQKEEEGAGDMEGKEDEERKADPVGVLEVKSGEESRTTQHLEAAKPLNPNVNSEEYLKSELTFKEDRLLDSDANGVMMACKSTSSC